MFATNVHTTSVRAQDSYPPSCVRGSGDRLCHNPSHDKQEPGGEQGAHNCSSLQSSWLPQVVKGSLLHFVAERIPTPIIEDKRRYHIEIAHRSAEVCVKYTLTHQRVPVQIQLLQRHKLAQVSWYASCLSHSGSPNGISKPVQRKDKATTTTYYVLGACRD